MERPERAWLHGRRCHGGPGCAMAFDSNGARFSSIATREESRAFLNVSC